LLTKHNGQWEYMRQSSEAFRYALMVYKDQGAGKLAIVTERNLQRAEKQVQSMAERQVVEPVSAQSFNVGQAVVDDIVSPFLSDPNDDDGISRVA